MNTDQYWHDRVAEIFGICAAGGDTHREVAVVSEYIEADYHGRFLIELVQNANDQAVDAGKQDGTVTLLRTDSLFAVANEGTPFDAAGLKSITSLGLSTKNPGQLIGNKGIGFKSVYQISRKPEIFSARSADTSFKAAEAWRLQILLKPFGTEEGMRRLEEICRAELESFPEQTARLRNRVQRDPLLALIDEVKQAAPFKFPLDITYQAAQARFAELGDLEDAQTLVVLPLIAGPKTTDLINQALDEILGGQGSAILFLAGVARLRIVDLFRGQEIVIEKHGRRRLSAVQGTAVFSEVTVAVIHDGATRGASEWRLAESVFGERESDAILLREAAAALPGSAWKEVDRCPVAVAVPLAPQDDDENRPLEGKLCIGLPTHDRTGTSAWVHSHFFGTISRKGIDLSEGTFNRLLFEEAIRLHAQLLDEMKTDAELRVKRAVTLAYRALATGPLLDALHAGPPLAHEPIVLAEFGQEYLPPSAVWMVEPAEHRIVRTILDAAGALSASYSLPDPWLAEHAGEVLKSLADDQGPDWKQRLLERASAGNSVLEAAATTFRSGEAGGRPWESFFQWLQVAYRPFELRDQRILPVVGHKLAAAAETVFLPFANPVGNVTGEDRATDASLEGADFADLRGVPPEVLSQLRFLDSEAVKIREDDGRKLTPLSLWLSPEVGERLVRRPSVDEIINQTIGPALAALSSSAEDLRHGIVLLELVASWLPRLTGIAASKVNKTLLLVPVVKNLDDLNLSWTWRPAPDTYFGAGWLDEEHETLIEEAYGQRGETLTISRRDFLAARQPGREELDWVNALEQMGVSRYPKWLTRPPQWRRVSFKAYSYNHLDLHETECPIAVAAIWWRNYLEAVRWRKNAVRSGYDYDFAEVHWVDGLENEASRVAVFRLMLLHCDHYERCLQTSLARDRHHGDATQPDAFWVHAIKANGWPVIPSTHGLKAPGEVWLTEGGRGTQSLKRLETLFTIRPEHRRAAKLLGAVGVGSLAEPSVPRLVAELNRLARSCDTSEPPTRAQSLLAMAQDLYDRLQRIYVSAASPLPDLTEMWLPLEQAGRLVGRPAKSVRIAYVDDAPERAPFVRGFADALRWPVKLADKALTADLRRQLGTETVTFTSAAPAWTGFESGHQAGVPLLEWIRSTFPGRSVATDLGCMIAYTGRETTAPTGEQFGRIWRAFEGCRLVTGRFAPGSPADHFLETREKGERELQVAEGLDDTAILAATWLFVGSSYRDTWAAYVSHLRDNQPALFFQQRGILLAHREEVEAAIKVSLSGRLERFRPAFFALRKKLTEGVESAEAFAAGWELHAHTAENLHRWLGGVPPLDFLIELGHLEEESGTLRLLGTGNISVAQWQSARRELGQDPFHFPVSADLWRDVREQVRALVKAVSVRSPQSNLDEVRAMLEVLGKAEVPSDLGQKPPEFAETLGRALALFREEAAKLKAIEFGTLLKRRLTLIEELKISTVRELKLTDPPERDVREYRMVEAQERAQTASDRLDALLEISQAMAAHLGEAFERDALQADSRIQATVGSFWGNRFCLLTVFQGALQKLAPRTQGRLSGAGIFHESRSRNEMYMRLPELVRADSTKVIRPERRLRLLGADLTEAEVRADLARASSVLGQKIRDIAKADTFYFLPGTDSGRSCVAPPVSGRKPRRRGGMRGGSTSEREQDKALHGRLGEIFVYELLRARGISGFDDAAWQSENRAEYLGEGVGDDRLGYDFSFRDEAGSLTGQPGVLCLLEVKSSTGDADGPFPMSANEWERAMAAHQNEDEEYLILRVARVNETPTLVDVLADPYQLRGENKLQLVTADLWIYPGHLEEPPGEQEPPAHP